MKIRILDRVLVAVAGLILLACCAGLVSQVFFGKDVVGFVTRGRGITVHRSDCINILNLPELERNRIIEAEWDIDDNNNDTYRIN